MFCLYEYQACFNNNFNEQTCNGVFIHSHFVMLCKCNGLHGICPPAVTRIRLELCGGALRSARRGHRHGGIVASVAKSGVLLMLRD